MTHRVTEIREHSNKSKWHYIPSKFNVADDCTRPIKFEEFYNSCRYLNCPKFLRCLENSFPVNLNNINFESKYLKEKDEVSQKRAPVLFCGNDFQIAINSLELLL